MGGDFAALGWVALGGAVGAPLRFIVSGFIGRRFGETFPLGTLAVNATGALCIGAVAALMPAGPADAAWLLAVTGVLGSYTTVSSFSLQTLNLVRDGQISAALANAALSLGLCLGAAAVGFALGGGFAHG